MNANAPAPQSNARPALSFGDVARAAVLGIFLLGALWLVYATSWGQSLTAGNVAAIRARLEPYGTLGPVVFVLAGAVLQSLGFPRLALACIAGMLYGVLRGTVIAELATVCGATLTYALTRRVGRSLFIRRLGQRGQRLNTLLRERGFVILLLIRLCPVGNSFLTSYLAGVAGVRLAAFIGATLLGYLPLTFVMALLGSGFAHTETFYLRTAVSIGLFVATLAVAAWYYRRSPLLQRVIDALRKAD